MKISCLLVATACFLVHTATTAADPPAKLAQLNERYSKDRARGLILLNERYIQTLQEEVKSATKAGRLDEAIAMQDRIGELEAEISRLGDSLAEAEMTTEPEPEDDFSLEGKTVWFPHDTSPDKAVGFKFLGDGKAIWIGLGGHEVDRAYKNLDHPQKFQVWWPERENDVGYEIEVADDGKTATVRNLASDLFTDGEIKRSR